MARIDVPFELTKADVLESYRAVVRPRIVPLALCLLVLASVSLLDGDVGAGAAAVVGVVLAVVLSEAWNHRLSDKLVSAMPSGRIVADGSRLELHSPLAALSYDWALYVRARRLRRVWLLRSRTGAVLSIPISAFGPEQAEAFEGILRSRGLLAPQS